MPCRVEASWLRLYLGTFSIDECRIYYRLMHLGSGGLCYVHTLVTSFIIFFSTIKMNHIKNKD